MPASATRWPRAWTRTTRVTSQPAGATMLRPGSTISRAGSGTCARTADANAAGEPVKPPPRSTRALFRSSATVGQQPREAGERLDVADVGADVRPDRRELSARFVQRAARRRKLVQTDPELRGRRTGGKVRVRVGRDTRVDADADPPLARSQQCGERAERLGVDEGAGGERVGEVGIGLADAVDHDPLGSAPARKASASSTGPTTSKPKPSAASRRSSAGSGLALTAYATSAPGSASRQAPARAAAASRSVTYSGVPKRSAASTSRLAVTARRRPSGAETRPRRRGS